MGFSTSLMPKTRQITRLRLVIRQDFLAFVMWKKPYSHFLLTVFSQCFSVLCKIVNVENIRLILQKENTFQNEFIVFLMQKIKNSLEWKNVNQNKNQ